MPTEIKQKVVEELTNYLKDVQALVLTDFTGLTVEEATEFRRRCRQADLMYRVVKNRLARIAANESGLEALSDHLRGPTGIVASFEDPVAAAKVVKQFEKEYGRPSIKVGFMEGDVIERDQVNRLADLPSREILLAQVTAGIGGPLSGFVGTLTSLLQGFVGTLDSIAKQKSQ